MVSFTPCSGVGVSRVGEALLPAVLPQHAFLISCLLCSRFPALSRTQDFLLQDAVTGRWPRWEWQIC